jgi:hypothetical protein
MAQGRVSYIVSDDGLTWEELGSVSENRHLYSDFLEISGRVIVVYGEELGSSSGRVIWRDLTAALLRDDTDKPQGVVLPYTDALSFLDMDARTDAIHQWGSASKFTNSKGVDAFATSSFANQSQTYLTFEDGEYLEIAGKDLNLLHDGSDFTMIALVRIPTEANLWSAVISTYSGASTATGTNIGYSQVSGATKWKLTVGKSASGDEVYNADFDDSGDYLDKWVCVAVSRDASATPKYSLYLEGDSKAWVAGTDNEDHVSGDSSQNPRIGKALSAYNGDIDIQKQIIFDRSLSAEEIRRAMSRLNF